MERLGNLTLVITVLIAAIACGGCNGGNATSTPANQGHQGHDHASGHDEAGPHGGHLIELGRDHKYHAELVENEEAERLIVYLYDEQIKELAIEQPSISLTLTSAGTTSTFELAGVTSEGASGSSRFESADAELFKLLEQRGEVIGKLRVTIEGTPYTGNIEHHDHHEGESSGHDH
jgi:hypothetical protein